jgi:hypothetical protein
MNPSSALRGAGLLALIAAILGPDVSSAAALGNNANKPPSSLEPAAKSVPLRISHRHLAIRECGVRKGQVCAGQEVDADTSTTVRLERVGVMNAALVRGGAVAQVTFPHHVGPQEQMIELAPGDWLIDWRGASGIGHLHVAAGAQPQVTLQTWTGHCQIQDQTCRLDATRSRRLVVRDDATH